LSLGRLSTEFAPLSVCRGFDHFFAEFGQKSTRFGPEIEVVTFPAHFCLDIDLRLRENPTAERRGTGKKQGIFLDPKPVTEPRGIDLTNFEEISNWL
jgi:hypothetical protein